MDGAAGDQARYGVPEGVLGLGGPVEKPAPGTLPLRGDLAHIALAGTHLAAHYVIPHHRLAGTQGATLRLLPSHDAEVTQHVAPGAELELLDVAGDWAWVCLGAAGPSGYCLAAQLAPAEG